MQPAGGNLGPNPESCRLQQQRGVAGVERALCRQAPELESSNESANFSQDLRTSLGKSMPCTKHVHLATGRNSAGEKHKHLGVQASEHSLYRHSTTQLASKTEKMLIRPEFELCTIESSRTKCPTWAVGHAALQPLHPPSAFHRMLSQGLQHPVLQSWT